MPPPGHTASKRQSWDSPCNQLSAPGLSSPRTLLPVSQAPCWRAAILLAPPSLTWSEAQEPLPASSRAALLSPSQGSPLTCRSRSDCSSKKVVSFQGSSKIRLQAQAPVRKAQPPTKPGDLPLLPQGQAPGTAKIPSRRGRSQGPRCWRPGRSRCCRAGKAMAPDPWELAVVALAER